MCKVRFCGRRDLIIIIIFSLLRGPLTEVSEKMKLVTVALPSRIGSDIQKRVFPLLPKQGAYCVVHTATINPQRNMVCRLLFLINKSRLF